MIDDPNFPIVTVDILSSISHKLFFRNLFSRVGSHVEQKNFFIKKGTIRNSRVQVLQHPYDLLRIF